ncbi:hypothetical protein FA95DRAFT_1678602 [Auriscalpium vulgare]|uniref:Uncharacterized protein n=1 Tax=Auriscalpium vulgare TaxID=40419 RepID=A0ACB8RWZ2_9AGAM|nr:hypothetical protein FA95DRAFT_1678602 [Auriscalpium vulgare]
MSAESNTFYLMLEEQTYIDKTEDFALVLDKIGSGSTPIHLILRPRRTGKSMFLQTLAEFLMKRNPGELLTREKAFKSHKLAITRRSELFTKHFGTHIVLYLDFTTVSGSTLTDLKEKFVLQVLRGVRRMKSSGCFRGIRDSDMCPYDREFMDRILKVSCAGLTSKFDASDILSEVIRIANELCHRSIFLIVDEYDTPVNHAIDHGYYEEASDFFQTAFGDALKNNLALTGAVLAGVMNIAKGGWLSGMNQIREFTMQSRSYATTCMFTDDDVAKLYRQTNQTDEPLPFSLDELAHWYGGYQSVSGIKLYNPWSVQQALTDKRLGSYWEKTGTDRRALKRMQELLDGDVHFRNDFNGLIDVGHITAYLHKEMVLTNPATMTRSELLTYMHYTGYLNAEPAPDKETDALFSHNITGKQDNASEDEILHSPTVTSAVIPPCDSKDREYNSDSGYSDDEDIVGPSDRSESEELDSAELNSEVAPRDEVSAEVARLTIPNQEVRELFHNWLKNNVADKLITAETISESKHLFKTAYSGTLQDFADDFSVWIEERLPPHFFGQHECVYHAYIYGYFRAAAECIDASEWSVKIEKAAGEGRLDMVIQGRSETSHQAVIHEYKRLAPKEKKGGGKKKVVDRYYKTPSIAAKLEKLSREALDQIAERQYRTTSIAKHVTELREVGIAFLKRNTAITSRLLVREPGKEWRVKEVYTVENDRVRRERMYCNV